ncbi:NSFL1 cofactor p47 [Tyrophagus putrescentiae]|nr:NSFL1 cofactor p47 [Tyrophagus putrescentiae]
MADDNPKTPPGSPPASLPKKDDRSGSRRPQSSATYSDGPNIATLFSQPQKRHHDHQNRQAFYTGGSEHSGQQVLGPRNDEENASKRRKIKKLFKRLLKQMRENQQEEDDGEENASSSHVAPFTGNGFTLGNEETGSQRVEGPNITQAAKSESEANRAADTDSKPVRGMPVFRVSGENTPSYFEQFSSLLGVGFTLGNLGSNEDLGTNPQRVDGPSTSKVAAGPPSVVRIWSNGVTFDDGPLLSYTELTTMRIYANFRRNLKNMRIENHQFEEYKQPATFAGEGNRLKVTAEAAKSKQPKTTATATSSASSSGDPVVDRAKALSAGLSFLSFDQSQPGTRIQIRLADGSRIIVQINTSRLVSDLRQYIITAHPEYSETEFQLMNTFPTKVIDQENVTIKESGLANSSLVQHLI